MHMFVPNPNPRPCHEPHSVEIIWTSVDSGGQVHSQRCPADKRYFFLISNTVAKLQGAMKDCAVSQAGAAKQTTIGDFFARK